MMVLSIVWRTLECKSFHELSSEIRSLMFPRKSIIELQKELLRVAPFGVKQNILDKVK